MKSYGNYPDLPRTDPWISIDAIPYVCMSPMNDKVESAVEYANPTALLLIDVAEELFALHGYNAASVRDITTQAKVNLGAMTYHFGTKENLLKAILHRGATSLNAERMRRFDELNRARAKPKVAEVIRAFIEPAFALLDTAHGVRFLRIQNDISAERTDVPRAILAEHYDPCALEYMRHLGKAAPHLDQDALAWCFQFTLGAMLYSLTQPKRFLDMRSQGADHVREQEELVRFVTNALGGRHQRTDAHRRSARPLRHDDARR